MILKTDGKVNRYHIQTLCLIFFPGAKFGEDEVETPETPVIDVRLEENDGQRALARVSVRIGDKKCEATGESIHTEGNEVVNHEKIAVGRAFIAACKEFFHYSPPWGMLTGVRPAKVATEYLLEGRGIQKTRRVLRDEYLLNPKKAALATSVAANELKLMKHIKGNLCSIYISIPFCPSRCAYCSFVSYTSAKLLSLVDDYLRELYIDIDNMFETARSLGMTVATVYIGGGTPTTLSARQLDTLLSRIEKNVDTSSLMEFTLEAGRPDTIDAEKLAVAKSHGVTRISVNPQTLNDEVLASIGRKHTVADFYRAYSLASESGIRDINVDLIAGLPDDNFASFSKTVDKIIELAPTNITVHTFCVKKASDILRNNSNIYSLSGGDAAKSVEYSQLKTKLAQYKPYYMYRQKNTVGNLENVGFAKEGHEGLYNVFMMEEVQSIFAVGAGGVTKLVEYHSLGDGGRNMERIFTPKYPYEYLRDAEKIRRGDPEKGIEPISDRIRKFYRKD